MRPWLAVLLPLFLGVSAPAATTTALSVHRADLRFAGDRARLVLETDLDAASRDAAETLRVTVGTTVVADAALFSDRAKPRTNDWMDLLVRDPSHLGAKCRLRLEYRPTSGFLRMKLSGFDAAAIRDAGPAAVPVVVEISGRSVRASVDFVVRNPRRWAYAAPGHGPVGPPAPPPDPPGDPPPPPPPPGPGEYPSWRGIAYGGDSGITTPVKTVIRSAGAFETLWSQHAPGTPAPQVDFSKEMVLVYIAGPGQPSNRVTIYRDWSNGILTIWGSPARNHFGGTGSSPYCMYASTMPEVTVVWK